ncbi:zinc-binding dehydrogenase family oxidoreductase [Hyaloscypha variabilis F]|uniref:Zinc-binding dehydrogenase family oxidoreductase n=1 Tax=Hyaloscypha variabilis (strain UAMH 11265 / GT02V1 / F) TaxID=1149755 RepID=A0A2J6R569_HYAVF|nr:zinc-binding dehydrogenase family oxidoreductase [Hyaloscypha variabilis F]
MSPVTAKAIVQRNRESGRVLVEETIELPALEEHQVLVRVINSALNPTDVQSFDGDAFGDGAVLGCDFAGIVEELGPKVSTFVVGDRIVALIWGGEIHPLGAYSTYCIADERISFKIPKGLDFPEASTIPLASNTAWLALLSKDCLNIPRSNTKGTSVLVWGGSSTVGIFAIQLSRKLGLDVVTTCSPRNNDVVKSAGASLVFDYRDPLVVAKIAETVPDLRYAFDTIGNATSSTMAAEAMGSNKGNVCTVRPGKQYTENVPKHILVTDVLVFTAFLKPHVYKKVYKWPTRPEDHALSAELYQSLPQWIEQGVFKPQRTRRMGKLSAETLAKAMQLYRDNALSNEKCVFDVGTA